MSGLNHKTVFLSVPRAGASEIKAPRDAALEGSTSDSQKATFCCVLMACVTRHKGQGDFCGLLHKGTNPICEGSTAMTKSSQSFHLQMPLHWGLGFNKWILEEHKVHSASTISSYPNQRLSIDLVKK